MDCTVANFTPFEYVEKKPGQVPDEYIIPPATENDTIPGILHVKNTHSNLYMPLQEYTYRVPIPGDVLARDIAFALVSAKLEFEYGVSEPAIFAVEGHHSAYAINHDFKKEVERALVKQAEWCRRLVKMADDDWQRLRQHKMITDVQRWAAKRLQLNREWRDIATPVTALLETVNCQFCGTLRLKNVAICPSCRQVVDASLLAQLQKEIPGVAIAKG